MQLDPVCRVGPKAAPQLRGERGVEGEPGDLVLVLVGHQLVQLSSDRLAQLGRRRGDLRLAAAHLRDHGPVAGGIRLVLVGDQLSRPRRDQRVECGR